MKPNNEMTFALAGLLLVSAASQAGASVNYYFTGDFAPGNWTTPADTASDGPAPTAAFTISTLTISAANNTGFVPGNFNYEIAITPSETVNYTLSMVWSLTDKGDLGTPTATYAVINPSNASVYNGETASYQGQANQELDNVYIPAGDELVYEFTGSGAIEGKDGADLGITIVPEPGGWLAGALLLGVVAVSVVRQNLVRRDKSSQ